MKHGEQIRTYILKMIQTCPVNTRLPTEHELMKRFKVARQTVHGEMARLGNEGLVVRRRRAGTFIASGTAPFQYEMDPPEGDRVLLVYPNWFAYDIWQKMLLAEREIVKKGLVPCHVKLDPESDLAGLKQQVMGAGSRNRVRGIVMIPPGAMLADAELSILDSLGVPTAIMVPIGGIERFRNLHTVTHDYERAGAMAIELLLGRGHRSFGYMPTEPWSLSSRRLQKGMRMALARAGVSARALHAPRRRSLAWAFTPDLAVEMALPHLRDSVTALLVDSADVGVDAVVRACYLKDVRIPRDASLVAFADRSAYYSVQAPRPCLVTTPRGKLVERAMSIVLGDEKTKARESILPVMVDLGESIAGGGSRE
jgi:DNA-binding LacI/PurR family transcriptional regulator